VAASAVIDLVILHARPISKWLPAHKGEVSLILSSCIITRHPGCVMTLSSYILMTLSSLVPLFFYICLWKDSKPTEIQRFNQWLLRFFPHSTDVTTQWSRSELLNDLQVM